MAEQPGRDEPEPDRSSELDRQPLSPIPGHERAPESEPLEPLSPPGGEPSEPGEDRSAG